jgi:hypothetical protein
LIGGEGISSRGHTVQGGEREKAAMWVSEDKSHRKRRVIQSFSYNISIHICGSQWRQSQIFMGQRRESHGCPDVREGKVMDVLGNMLVQGRTEAHESLGLFAVYNSLSGPLSLLREP